jgi:hypothetical protein
MAFHISTERQSSPVRGVRQVERLVGIFIYRFP